jgi:ribonuclease HI
MDDTTWIANNKETLQEITDTAEEFYTLNDIQTNPKKSYLLIINGSTQDRSTGITLQGQQIIGTEPDIAVRILGVWHNSKGTKQYQQQLIKQKIRKTSTLIGMRRVTDKQARYIINHVMMPSLEYLLNDMYIPENICNNLITKIAKTFKHKVGLANTTPNNCIYNKLEYGIFHIFDRQVQLHATNWLNRINLENTTGKIARFRLQSLQNQFWSHNNILDHMDKPFLKKGRNLTHDILWLLKTQGIKFRPSNNPTTITTINKTDLTIEEIMGKHFIHKHRTQLHKHNILFIGQLFNATGTHPLLWCQLTNNQLTGKKGKQPNWFESIYASLNSSFQLNTLQIHYNNHNPFNQTTTIKPNKMTKKHWAATLSENETLIGKKKKVTHDQQIIYTHYKRMCNQSPLEKCSGCQNNEEHYPSPHCSFSRPIHQLLQIPISLSKVSTQDNDPITELHQRIRISPGSLQNYLQRTLVSTQPSTQQPSILIDPKTEHYNFLETTFTTNTETINQLHNIAIQISHHQNFQAYTDGSLSTHANKQLMGFGWTLTDPEYKDYQFQGQTHTFPSSTRAEIMAILTLISIIPRDSTIKIHTDSQAAITNIHKALTTHITKRFKKYHNWQLTQQISEICNTKNINLELHKVQAHTGITGNEIADQLASIDPINGMKPGHNTINLNTLQNHHARIQPYWKNTPIDTPIRQFCQTIIKAKRLAQWRLLNRSRYWLDKNTITAIDWKNTFKYLHPSPIGKDNTSQNDHTLRKFAISLWNEELPTKQKLHTRSAQLYKDNKCHQCQETETNIHPFICDNQINKTRSEIYKIIIKAISTKVKPNYKHTYQHLFYCNTSLQYDHTLKQCIKGAIHQNLTNFLYKVLPDNITIQKVIGEISLGFKTYLYQVWKTRCDTFNTWEKQQGIDNKKKKNIKYSQNKHTEEEILTDHFYKDQFVDLTNKYIDTHINSQTPLFSLLLFDLRDSTALAC